MNTTEHSQPMTYRKWRWICAGIAASIGWLLTLLVVYEMNEYGVGLFVAMPFLLGALPTILVGMKFRISGSHAWQTGLTALAVYALGVLGFAIEGLICVIMGFPIAMLLVWIGSIIGYAFVKKAPANSMAISAIVLVIVVPLTSLIERDTVPAVTPVVTSVDINADPQTVWNSLIAFPPIAEPEELLFKAGISYPISSRIEGKGVGAIRHCTFNTGSFVEPITVWDEPHLLRFSVKEQPVAMRELSFWDIDAPHLHDYFVSTQGQFNLIDLGNGKTRLEGTTWYYLDIHPNLYWKLWSDYIIHKIHERVLEHIKRGAEGLVETRQRASQK